MWNDLLLQVNPTLADDPASVNKDPYGNGWMVRIRITDAEAAALAPEEGGPKGPEPTRFGDWERKGIAVDF